MGEEGAASNAPTAERVARRYQCSKPSSRPVVPSVERSEDACGQRGRAAVIDELQKRVHIGPRIVGERVGEPGLEAGSLEPSAAPRSDADQIEVDARRM